MNVLVKVDWKQHLNTFDTRAEAKLWAASFERHLKNPTRYEPPAMQKETFAMVMQAYKRMVTPTKSQREPVDHRKLCG